MRKMVAVLVLALLLPGCLAGVVGGLIVSDLQNQAYAEELARQNNLLSLWRSQGMAEAEIMERIRTTEPEWWGRLTAKRRWAEHVAAERNKPKPVPRYPSRG